MIPIGFAGVSQGYQDAEQQVLKNVLAQQHRALEAARLQAQIYHYQHPGMGGRHAGGDAYYPPISTGPTPAPGGVLLTMPQPATSMVPQSLFSAPQASPQPFIDPSALPPGMAMMAAPSTMPPQPQVPSPEVAPPPATAGAPPAVSSSPRPPAGGAALTHQQLADDYNRQMLAGGTKARLARLKDQRNYEQSLADKEARAAVGEKRGARADAQLAEKQREFDAKLDQTMQIARMRISAQQTAEGRREEIRLIHEELYAEINKQYASSSQKERDAFIARAKQKIDALKQEISTPPAAPAPVPAPVPGGFTPAPVPVPAPAQAPVRRYNPATGKIE